MKNLFFVLLIITCPAFAQDAAKKVMEQRARELHRVLTVANKEQWKKFIRENYTQALIDKPMRAVVDDGEGKTEETDKDQKDMVEGKAGMFQMLHNDFGDGKIISLKPNADKLVMVIQNGDGLRGTFTLTFETAEPFRIAGIGIDAGM